MLQLLLCNYNTFPFFLMYLHAEDGKNLHAVALKFCWLITREFNTLILIPWKTFNEMFPQQQLIHMATENKPKETETLQTHATVSVWKSSNMVTEPVMAWLLCHGTSCHHLRDLPRVQMGSWFKRRGSSPLPWEYCPAEHFKVDTFPPASFKNIPESHHTHGAGSTCLAP